MANGLKGKVAIVTGASRGIGRAIAGRLAAEGAQCVLCARDQERLAQAAGVSGAFLGLDLREPDAPARLAAFAVERFGRIDIVVNNAGATRRGPFLGLSEDDWSDGFALKFFGAVRLCRAAWPHLVASHGSVVNIAGAGGRTPGAEFAVGGSVNAALLSFTKSLAETGINDGVQVNAVNPGTVRTDRFRARLATMGGETAEAQFVKSERITRVGEPEDIAALVAFIVSAEGRFLQGSMIDMDGGFTKTL